MKKIIIAMFGSVLGASAANAGGPPVMFSKCGEKIKLRQPENSSGYYFSEDCKTIYILPPKNGEIMASSPTELANTSLCPILASNLKRAESMSKEIIRLSQLSSRVEVDLGLYSARDPWLPKPISEESEEEVVIDSARLKQLNELNEEIEKASSHVIKINETFSEIEGPKVKLTISADHDQLLIKYRDLNPKLDIQKMPIAKSQLTYIRKSKSNVGKAPAAIHWSVAGTQVASDYFTGIKPGTDLQSDGDSKSILFSSSVSGQIVLSLVGACPFIDLRTGKMPEIIDAEKLTPYIVSTIDYAYNVSVNRAYRAEYNLYELFRRVHEQYKKKRLFSSKTYHSLIIEEKSEGWFKFTSLSEHPDLDWDKQLSQTIKAQLIERMLARLGAVPFGTSDIPDLVAPGENGATTISNDLMKCPDVYCQAGAYILKGLDAIFASGKAMSELKRELDHTENEEVVESRMVPQLNQVRLVK